MPSKVVPADGQTGFNLTTASTLNHLIFAGVTCAGLWTIIIAAFGA
ncbi:MAG: hypothetical protein OXR03_02825 [Rhodospirillaceae bacterium]|nr:hypothetical protein [Rhodospirillaceae bacterium]MDD9924740.1 hypothetical protein [Rhodospirillaceae bacterium]